MADADDPAKRHQAFFVPLFCQRARSIFRASEENRSPTSDQSHQPTTKSRLKMNISRATNYKYVVYTAEDAFPGMNWLKIAYEERSGKGLLAFNDGKWFGKLAAFGMARSDWARENYSSRAFFFGYKSHYADNEISIIASRSKNLVFNPNSLLIEIDYNKATQWSSNQEDRKLFNKRRLELGLNQI
jgi:hypothetical protein